MHRVFCYGSNMHLVDLARWMRGHGHDPAGVRSAGPAVLDGFALVWNYRSPVRSGGAANVAPTPLGTVHGVLLEVDDPALLAIDEKEGHPERYDRGARPRPVRTPGAGRLEAWLYVVTPAWVQPAPVPPRKAYLDLVIEGARQQGLPRAWIAQLRRITTLD